MEDMMVRKKEIPSIDLDMEFAMCCEALDERDARTLLCFTRNYL